MSSSRKSSSRKFRMSSSRIWRIAWATAGLVFASAPFLMLLVLLVLVEILIQDKRGLRAGQVLVRHPQWWYGGWWVLVAWMNAHWLLGSMAVAVFFLERAYSKHKKKKHRHKSHLTKALAALAGGAALEKVMDNDQDEEEEDELFSEVQ